MSINRIDHIGIVVEDLQAAIAFFLDFGLVLDCEMDMGGALVERVIGLKPVQVRMAMMGPPEGQANIELIQYYSPPAEEGAQAAPAQHLGLRHICFNVTELDALIARLQQNHGATLVGEVVNYENVYKLCYLRGPEGIILELAEEIG